VDRRAGGTLSLAAALVAVVIVPRLLNPPVLDGVPSALPPPPAPAVGTCLANSVTSSWGADGVLRPSDTVYVGCDQPHRAEVFRVIDPLPAMSTSGTVFAECAGGPEVAAHLGATDDGWRPVLQMRTTASGPDARQVAAGQNWAACVLVDDVGPALTGPLTGAAASHTVPPQVGVCFHGTGADLEFRGTTRCDAPHGGELFGSREVAGRDVDDAAEPGALTASCRALVEADTRQPALTRDPQLVVEVVISDDVTDGGTTTARCVLRARDGRTLTGSVRQLGDGAVPWTA
jgi:hypothetical protein